MIVSLRCFGYSFPEVGPGRFVVVVGELEVSLMRILRHTVNEVEVTVSTDASGELHIFLLNGHSLGMHAAQVGVFEESYDVSFSGFLEGDESL